MFGVPPFGRKDWLPIWFGPNPSFSVWEDESIATDKKWCPLWITLASYDLSCLPPIIPSFKWVGALPRKVRWCGGALGPEPSCRAKISKSPWNTLGVEAGLSSIIDTAFSLKNNLHLSRIREALGDLAKAYSPPQRSCALATMNYCIYCLSYTLSFRLWAAAAAFSA